MQAPTNGGAWPHTPVLYQQVLSALNPGAGSRIIDGTVGAGGHAWGLLDASNPDGLLLGLDRDPQALALAEQRLEPFGQRVVLRQGNYANMQKFAATLGWEHVHAVLLDLGLSSMQLDQAERGFSIRRDGPLDMRFDPGQVTSAEDLVNESPSEELEQIIRTFGEEPRARRIVRAIVAARPIRTTSELANIVAGAVGGAGRRIHPATRTFQALRIAVNEELENLSQGLEQALTLLVPGGRLAVISFHSLEDRIVKLTFRRESQDCICPPRQPVCTCDHHARVRVLTKKPIGPDDEEIQANSRARSARLRVAARLPLA